MNLIITKTLGAAALCIAAVQGTAAYAQTPASSGKDVAQPTGTTGATAFMPNGSAKGEANASAGAQNNNAGAQQPAKPGFDNKPPRGAKAACHRPQGGVDASGGENLSTASKDNTTCTGKVSKTGKKG